MVYYELQVFNISEGKWELVTKIESHESLDNIMTVIHCIGKDKLNLRLNCIDSNTSFQHNMFMSNSSSIKDNKYLYPLQEQILKRAYQIWQDTGCNDSCKNYYQAIQELQK